MDLDIQIIIQKNRFWDIGWLYCWSFMGVMVGDFVAVLLVGFVDWLCWVALLGGFARWLCWLCVLALLVASVG
jgi:hypothetical protein